jgi:hypothetical protein
MNAVKATYCFRLRRVTTTTSLARLLLRMISHEQHGYMAQFKLHIEAVPESAKGNVVSV